MKYLSFPLSLSQLLQRAVSLRAMSCSDGKVGVIVSVQHDIGNNDVVVPSQGPALFCAMHEKTRASRSAVFLKRSAINLVIFLTCSMNTTVVQLSIAAACQNAFLEEMGMISIHVWQYQLRHATCPLDTVESMLRCQGSQQCASCVTALIRESFTDGVATLRSLLVCNKVAFTILQS